MDTLILTNAMLFLSTLSLRRATLFALLCNLLHHNFYPRSPCGERPIFWMIHQGQHTISIHALLAESDINKRCELSRDDRFLSTLSLRRATTALPPADGLFLLFLSTLSLRRATNKRCELSRDDRFLSTLSLRRATHWACPDGSALLFLSTLSLRRAT